jgi:alpha-galactosidase
MQTADKIVELGLDKLGYKYVNLDDCWQSTNRTADGHIIIDKRFPSGIKALADYMHARGLYLGLYSSAGNETCSNRAGGLGFEQIDANDYAAWGVDYLKYDNCPYPQPRKGKDRYKVMSDALLKSGRKIFYSICNWGMENTTLWAPDMGNSWRLAGDIDGRWG